MMNRIVKSLFLAVGLTLTAGAGEIAVKDGQTLVFMGDSITEYGEMMPYGYTHLVVKGLAANGVNVTWDGVGIRGEKASQMLARFDKDVFENANVGKKVPNAVTIASGANDIGGGVSCDSYLADMLAMANKVKAKGGVPLLFGPTASGFSEQNDDRIVQFAHALKDLAAKEGIAYGPWYERFRAYVDDPDTPVLFLMNGNAPMRATVDGCHMAAPGDRQLARASLEALGLDSDQMSKAEAAWNSDDSLATLVPAESHSAGFFSVSVKLTQAEANAISGQTFKQVVERGAASLAASPTLEAEAADASVTKTIDKSSASINVTFKTIDQLLVAARKLGIRYDQAVGCAILRAARGGTVPAASAPEAKVDEVIVGPTYALFDVTISSVGATAGACDVVLKYGTSAGSLNQTRRIAVGENGSFVSAPVSGLGANTTYHYELTVQNNATTVQSTTLSGSFTTRAASSALQPDGENDTSAMIQAAIDAAGKNGTVVLDGGVFMLDGELKLKDGVTLKGQGLAQTILHQRGYHRVATLDGGAKIEDVTVEGGKEAGFWPCGGGLLVNSGTVSRCRVRHNQLNSNNGYGAGIYIFNGQVDNCTVAFNRTTGGTSGAGGIGCNNATTPGTILVDSCLVYGNSVSSGNGGGIGFFSNPQTVTVRNTTVTGNSASVKGGGLYCTGKLSLVNSTVSGNTAPSDADITGTPASITTEPDTPGGESGGESGGHEAVQLWAGGPYFAKTNLGAEKETDFGYYYRFGGTVGGVYTGSGWKDQNGKTLASNWYNGGFTYSLSGSVLAPQYDAAHMLWGDGWRMMTAAERNKLKSDCDWAWATVNGVPGMKFTGKGAYSGNSIFLPDAGWSGSPKSTGCAYYFTGEASGGKPCAMRFGKDYIALETVHNGDKAYPVRAVSDAAPGPTHTHTWGTPSYGWRQTSGGWDCTATATCTQDASHKNTKTVSATYQVVTAAAIGKTGTGRYTATFSSPFATQTKDVVIPALHAHSWGAPTYAWSADSRTCTATAACTVSGCSETVSETVTAHYEVIREPTVEETGAAVSTATFANSLFAAQTRTVTLPRKSATADKGDWFVATTGSDAADGRTPETAFATVAKALSSAQDGDRICVLAGAYEITTALALDKAVTVLGETGNPADVVIRNVAPYKYQNDMHRVAVLNHAGAALADVTVEGGIASHYDANAGLGANILIDSEGGTVTNCIVQKAHLRPTGQRASGAGIACKSAAGLITHCVITENVAEFAITDDLNIYTTQGAACGVYLKDGILRDSLLANNTVKNHTFGTVVYVTGAATVENCTIAYNRAEGEANDNSKFAAFAVVPGNSAALTPRVRNCAIIQNRDLSGVSFANSFYGVMNPAQIGYVKDNFVNCATDGKTLYYDKTSDASPYMTAVSDFRLVNPAAGDFRPASKASPLVDAGAAMVSPVELDLDGNFRVSGEAVDIGCYEFAQVVPQHTHTWGTPDYAWTATDAGYACTAKAACTFTGCHETLTEVGAVVAQTHPATCTADGSVVYTATFATFASATKTVTLLGGHDWAVTYQWSDDKTACTGTAVCMRDGSHRQDEAAAVTLVVTQKPTTKKTGVGHYVATFANAIFVQQTSADVVLPVKEDAGGFTKSVTFTVNASAASAQTGFPLLVRLAAGAPAGFDYADCETDGSDIRFFAADGQPIPFEIDTWNPQGESLVWVKIASFASGTTFTMRYCGTPEEENDPTAVWSDYTGVWHLNGVAPETDASLAQSKGVYPNSTATEGIDGHLSVSSISGEEGRFGSAFKVNGATSRMGSGSQWTGGVWVNDAGAGSPLDGDGTFTISGWFKHQDWNYYWDHLFAKRSYTNPSKGGMTGSFSIEMNCENYFDNIGPRGGGNTPLVTANCKSSLKNWSYVTFVYSGTTCTVYQNGALVGSGTIAKATDNDAPLVFGNTSLIATQSTGDSIWQGWIDEVRYQNGVAKSAEWIAAEYAAMTAADLVTAGAVEDIEPTPPAAQWDVPGASGGIVALDDGHGGKCIRITSVTVENGKLKVGFEAGKVDAEGQTFGLVCKESLTDEKPFTINVTLKNGETDALGALEGATDRPSLFILGIGPAAK